MSRAASTGMVRETLGELEARLARYWVKAMRSTVHLHDELAQVPRR
ncbi:MAG: hypothetical protein ABW020_12255 [Candidatus Rokuibacteriota bacterium]